MAIFLITASYTSEGTKGLLQEGGSGRKAAIQQALQGMGGITIEEVDAACKKTVAYRPAGAAGV